MYGEADYEPSPLVARSLVSSIVPDAAADEGPVEPPSGDTGTGCATTTSTCTSTIVGEGPVTRMTRSSSSYEKFERHEEVHEVHGAVATDAAHGGPTAFSHNNSSSGQTYTSAGTPSRFKFACDTSAPTELAKMQDEAQKRRELFQSRVTEIEKEAAAWTARLANETIDRELHHEEVMEKSIRQPLEDVAERIMDRLEKRLGSRSFLLGDASGCTAEAESNDNDNDDVDADTNNADENKSRKIHAPSIMALDHKASELEEALIQHSSNCYNGRVEHLDAKIDTLNDEVQPALRLETIKADQREGALNRQYIAVAADATRRYAEENAARVADHEMLRATKEEKATEQPCDAEKILAEIRALGLLLDDERSERQRADEEIMATIIETRKAWQKIVIESLGD